MCVGLLWWAVLCLSFCFSSGQACRFFLKSSRKSNQPGLKPVREEVSPAQDKGPSVLKLGLSGQGWVTRDSGWCWNSDLKKYCPNVHNELELGSVGSQRALEEEIGAGGVHCAVSPYALSHGQERLERWCWVRSQGKGLRAVLPQTHAFWSIFTNDPGLKPRKEGFTDKGTRV